MKKIVKQAFYCCAAITVFLLCSLQGKSQNGPVYTALLQGDSIYAGKSITVQDTIFFNPPVADTVLRLNRLDNFITLRINEFSDKVLPDSFIVNVKVRVYYIDSSNLQDSVTEKTLSINYYKNKSYSNKTVYYLKWAYSLQVKVLEVTVTHSTLAAVLPLLELENRMVIDRDFKMNCDNHAIQTINEDTTTIADYGELKVSWTPNKVSENYDVEWTFIDKSALDNGRYNTGGQLDPILIFKNNATRITTTSDTCMIPLLYDGEGSLFVRVRGTMQDINGEIIATTWSSDYTNGLGRYDFNGHERNLNWQATTSFAEEGKRKSVVQYYDGSLRGRQTVTRDNSTRTTVVAESLYDKQGRPVIEVMPAPTLNKLIKYTPAFNVKDMNSAEFDKGVYDTLLTTSDYCSSGTDSMSAVNGASQYYSPNNPLKDDGYHKFIPDAKGYAFTEIQYMQDNTGRVYRQSGVGIDFKIGSGKETKYYYGSAEQTDLDALFGTEAGDASHYQKNMVRDANGQYSVSYVDMHGRTIATALAGTPPTTLQQLSSYRDSTQTEQLLNKSNNIINGTKVESSKSLLVTRAGTHTFNYGLSPDTLKIEDCVEQNVCYDCLYDLTITITDDCGNAQFGGTPKIITLNKFKLYNVDTLCNLVTPIDTSFQLTLQEGSYNITKSLSINLDSMAKYRDSIYLLRNTCKTYDSILIEQMQIIRDRMTDCGPDTVNRPGYLSYKDQMLLDLYPLIGQYADTATNRPPGVSVFDYTWRYKYQAVADTGTYLNENGEPDFIANGNGQVVPPQDLTKDEFIANFKESWAVNLLSIHPEYGLLVQYERFATSHIWDDDFAETKTFQSALTKGYLNPTGNSTRLPASNFTINNTDPLYNYDFVGNVKDVIEDSLFEYRNNSGDSENPYITVWGLATILAKCPESIVSDCAIKWNKSENVFNADSLCAGELDMAWMIFRDMYLEKKREWIDKFIRLQAPVQYPDSPFIAVFPRRDSMLAEAGYSDGTDHQQDIAAGEANANAYYAANCQAYATRWIQQLGTCNYTLAQRDTIINRLIAVCKEGADASHPLGSSSVKPGSPYQFKSFEEVINHYNTQFGITTSIDCNAYLIDKPLPYDHSVILTNKPVLSKPDSCECEKIDSLYNRFLANSANYDNFSSYMQQVLNTTISQTALDSLRDLCHGNIECKFIPNIIYLPPALQCGIENICVECDTVQNLYDSFLVRFPEQTPTFEEPDTIQQNINEVFAAYMNQHLGFTKSTQEYLSFKQLCDSVNIPPDSSTLSCANLVGLLNTYPSYYDSLVNFSYLPAVLDSGGCNVKYWAINPNTWVHNMNYRFNDFLQTGVLRQPVNDTSYSLNYSYRGPSGNTLDLCIDSSFTVETRIKFPIDSARKQTYINQGGTGYYGNIVFDLHFSGQKLFSVMSPSIDAGPHFIQQQWSPSESYGLIPDSNFVVDFTNWRTVKFKFTTSQITISIDGTPVRSFPNNFILGSRFAGLYVGAVGYDLQTDWFKFYDHKDSLRMFEDFEDCDWAEPGFNRSCKYDCDSSFKTYFNDHFNTNYSYSQIQTEYSNCGIDLTSPCSYDVLKLCGKNETVDTIINNVQDSPCNDSTIFATITATEIWRHYKDSLAGYFNERYIQKCLNAVNLESFTVTHPVSEYHYTLYYYDLAGNLVKTVPPEGVKPNRNTTWLGEVTTKRANGEWQVPEHTLVTTYRYNSLNQVVSQQSPDGGLSKFWYDRLGRLTVSQNQKQAAVNKYSYTNYDVLGRITEVGEKYNPNIITQTISRDATELYEWVYYRNFQTTYAPKMLTRTTYDVVSNMATVYAGQTAFKQKPYTLRNRVSYTRYFDDMTWYYSIVAGDTVYNPQDTYYNTAIEYNYDIHGNVDTLLNLAGMNSPINNHGANKYKIIAYKYDLISGKVNEVHYQPDKNDEFYHRYVYDADNKLTDVYTSDVKAFVGQTGLEEHEVYYQYYKHGQLARVVTGQQQVQGTDYAYTLQGWLKGINSTSLNPDHDMGNDGKTTSNNKFVARDAVGFNLSYFTGEYVSINSTVSPFPGHSAYMPSGEDRPLYNGNISSMAVNIGKFNQPQLYNYQYDQLNRIVAMDVYRGLSSNSWSAIAITSDYKERIAYDANGNILKYLRQGYSPTLTMDSLSYNYYTASNKLKYIRDRVNGASHNSNYTIDIDNQTNTSNYQYDAIGNLTSDAQEGLNSVVWNVYGKIKSIERTANSQSNAISIEYRYDPSGNRVGKDIWRSGATATFNWYIRDAQGNVMAVYEKTNNNPSAGTMYLKEHHLYGSSRLGLQQRNQNIDQAKVSAVNVNLLGATYTYNFERGKKFFELNNHLGNVLVTISDRKNGHDAGSGVYDYYDVDVVNANDYYPFGMQMPNRKYAASGLYRYGFNGKENDNEVKGEGNEQDYGMRIYDTRLGKFLSVDPIAAEFPWNSPYAYAENDPINYIDLDGLEKPNSTAQTTIGLGTRTVSKIFTDKSITEIGKKMAEQAAKNGGSQVVRKAAENWLLRGLKWTGTKTFGLTIGLLLTDGGLAGGDLPRRKVAHYEVITTDVSNLTEGYKNLIQERILLGTATAQDKLYTKELAARSSDLTKPKDIYENPGHHDPANKQMFDPDKSLLPENHEDLWKGSIGDPNNEKVRWTKVVTEKGAEYHRFSRHEEGKWHWSGSTGGKTITGEVRVIDEKNVPIEVRRM